jgi:ATP phosphoribosyltransferase
LRLGFGPADVAVAVPQCWLDVASISDLDEISARFYAKHGRRLRVATKYLGLTRRFFAEKGFTSYRIVESTGATEGAPATGSAEIIVDITTTGSTLKANYLKVLDDGVILRSEAVLAARMAIIDDMRVKALITQLAGHVRPR